MTFHVDTCQNPTTCLNVNPVAVVASAFAPIHISVLARRCSDLGIFCRANPTKLYIAGLVVAHAEQVKSNIPPSTCPEARAAFDSQLGQFAHIAVETPGTATEHLKVPWHAQPVRSSDLLATLDQLSRTELRDILSALKIPSPRNTLKGGLTQLLLDRFESTLASYVSLDNTGLRDWITSFYGHPPPADFTRSELLLLVLDFLFPQEALAVLMTCPYHSRAPTARTLRIGREIKQETLNALRQRLAEGVTRDYWPLPVPEYLKLACMSAYHTATQFRPAKTCASCARARVDLAVTSHKFTDGATSDRIDLECLRCEDPWLLEHPAKPFDFSDLSLCGLMLDPAGMVHHSASSSTVNLCSECESPIRSGRVPKLSLRNGLFRGTLPPELRDLTWIEERVCALYRATNNISRIFGSSNPDLPFVLFGNTCAHPQNVVETAKVLPRTAGDVADHIGVMFVGPGKYKPKGLETFRVRRAKLIQFMTWLRANNRLYRDVPLDETIFNEYPIDGPLPGIESRVVHNEVANPEAQFAQETAGLEPHPAQAGTRLGPDDEFVFMDALGVTNSSSDSIGARTFEAAALTNLLPLSMRTPDVTLHRGSTAVSEYGNHFLFPGLYPTLFPFGTGGLEDWSSQGEKLRVGFRTHANYLIDLRDRRFSAHPEFMFVVVNILQRRAVHLETRFRVRSSRTEAIAPEILSVTPEQIQRVADQLSHNQSYSEIDPGDQPVLELLRLVELVAAKVPGSHASKQALRRKIFAMCRHFGVPQVYLTLNPSPVQSPLFHLMAGDESVDLLSRFPRVARSVERSLRVAGDPAAAAYFFQLSIRLVFEHLLGWDFATGRSKPDGGILGHLEAFAMSEELTNRGVLHGHIVIWLRGGLNPSEARSRLAADTEFQDRFFKFWDAAIRHHLPDVDYMSDVDANPTQERPPQPPAFAADLHSSKQDPTDLQARALSEWSDEFTYEVKRVGEETQRHSHRDVCDKYEKDGKCRFHFPHEEVPTSHYDHKTNSIYLRCLDPWVNYFNPELLVMCRHNHDIKCILSGKAAQAAVYYITNYITKLDVNVYHVLSMVGQATLALHQRPLPPGQSIELRTLLHKCLARITREQQLHAQKAARYIRGNDDSMVSHVTVPMMTGLLMQHCQKLYMRDEIVDEDVEEEPDAPEHDVATERSGPGDSVPGEAPPDDLDPSQDIRLKPDGTLEVHSQLEDYLYRGDALSHLNYYDFVKLLKLVPSRGKKLPSPRLFPLDAAHGRSDTHILEYRSGDGTSGVAQEFVPLSLGPPTPRKSEGNYYRLFCLSHFKPFSARVPLVPPQSDISSAYLSFAFSASAERRMQNWEALHECEDERDAERLARQARKNTEQFVPSGYTHVDESGYTLDPALIPEAGKQRETYKTWATLLDAGWFHGSELARPANPTRILADNLTQRDLKSKTKTWRNAVKDLEQGKTVLLPSATISDARTSIGSALDRPPQLPTTEGLPELARPNLTVETADVIASEFTLNAAQRRAYNVTIQWLIAYVTSPGTTSAPKPAPLRMILHGPGGTGKTHSLRPIERVLELVRLSDAVVRVAPTGTAASLINGRTVHNAIKLKVVNKQGDTVETFEITWSPSDRKHMQDLFGSAILVVLDEFSLASAKMLGQLDTALRMVKQNWDEPFGGMSIILSGDLCQYPPVGETALWVPLSAHKAKPKRKHDISLERLGRLAYKSFDTVIEFTEQQRMRADPTFGDAVRRLRTRECTVDDVTLFNTRAVRTETRPNGVDLDSPEFLHASVITSNNHTRTLINDQKAKALGSHLERYFDVAADDRVKDGGPVDKVTHEMRRRVLGMVNHDSKNKSLHGRIKLYEGMPVILKYRNLSVPLKVTNGAQGILRELCIHTDSFGEVVADVAFVEFPDSNVEIPGLPPKVYPILPISCVVVAPVIDPESQKVVPAKFSRKQLPIEGAFAVTGHSAQGKTMPVVVCDPLVDDPLRGFYIYVSFSRARNLASLALLNEVTLRVLNSPLPPHLKYELRRLSALAHNTAVRSGDIKGPLVPVPEPELEAQEKRRAVVRETRDVQPILGKRVRADNETPTRKKPRIVETATAPRRLVRKSAHQTHQVVQAPPLASSEHPCAPFQGPVWDSKDWSCAFDAALTASFACWMALAPSTRASWASLSVTCSFLIDLLSNVAETSRDSAQLSYARDLFRDRLALENPALARNGARPTELGLVLQLISRTDTNVYSIDIGVTTTCQTCGTVLGMGTTHLPLSIDAPESSAIELQHWIDTTLARSGPTAGSTRSDCCGVPQTIFGFDVIPPIIYFELDPRSTVFPNVTMTLCSTVYSLGAIIHLSGDGLAAGHFKVTVLVEGHAYAYDGASNGGRAVYISEAARGGLTLPSASAGACAYVYYRSGH